MCTRVGAHFLSDFFQVVSRVHAHATTKKSKRKTADRQDLFPRPPTRENDKMRGEQRDPFLSTRVNPTLHCDGGENRISRKDSRVYGSLWSISLLHFQFDKIYMKVKGKTGNVHSS